MRDRVTTIRALGDNYIYVYAYGDGHALAVDPGEASGVLREVEEHGLRLEMVLITHHHGDHTGGAAELKRKTGCRAAGPLNPGLVDKVVGEGDVIEAGDTRIDVIATPGHTRGSVCYRAHGTGQPGALFTGDTLFVAGCGRIFGCDAATMWESLCRLSRLPEDCLVYCGHDYTIENLEFALTIEPHNAAARERLAHMRRIVASGGRTVPSTIGLEKLTNCFLRADSRAVRKAVRMPDAPAAEVFAELRRRKDFF